MSRSYRSQKESAIAARRAEQRVDGTVVLPRVIERAPAPGDIHPLSKPALTRLLQKLPLEYVYGLSRIELRARQGSAVGCPFGCYRPDERAIILYSLPTLWRLQSISKDFARSLSRFYADFTFEENAVLISWRDNAVMGLWFYCDVFTHELGHHFAEQYKSKNGKIEGRRFGEFTAALHARRFTDGLFDSYRRRKPQANPLQATAAPPRS